jgi:transcription termination factor NusB
MNGPPGGGDPRNDFRGDPRGPGSGGYNQQGPPGPGGFRGPPAQFARTTAQGRPIPERHNNEDRSMSMTGYPPNFGDSHTISSGRVVPNRRPNEPLMSAGSASSGGGGGGGFGGPQGGHMAYSNGGNGHINAYAPSHSLTSASSMHNLVGGGGGYGPPKGGRTTSMTSSISGHDVGRTMSMASTIAPTISEGDSATLAHRPSTRSMDSERPPTARIRAPVVYPALLSRVGAYFRRKIQTGDRVKNELTYTHAFSGQEAVDVLAYCIRTTDRNLALLLGRSLDAQKFFHDVTYEHRLRDSPNEMYQFRETQMDNEDDQPTVNGVFVLLSECYSPTCTRDQLCYSIACPRRLEQVSRLNLKPQPGLRGDDTVNINTDDADQTDEQKLWINSVPKEVAESVSEREQKRQEIMSEICYTERDFVKDLEYLRDFWIMPLRSKQSPVPAQRRDKVVRTIFSNIIDPPSIHAVSSRFAKSLTERQQKEPVMRNLGDIFLEFVPQFQPFIHYGSKQLEAKSAFEAERAANDYFSKFVDEIERRKESRKLELNGYLTKPTTRLARYPLLLENVLKYTEDDNPDKEDIPKVLVMVRDILGKVNAESGKAENRFNLRRLHEQLRFRPHEKVDLRLTDDGRELVFKAVLKKSPTDPTEITAFLFDHAVLLVRIKTQGKAEEVKAFKRVRMRE